MSDGITDAWREQIPENLLDGKKIMICGPSGTGKTTLAKHISEAYRIPFLSMSSKALWDKYGYKSHNEAVKTSFNDPGLAFKYQWDILRTRRKQSQNNPSFITDRSFVDNVVYIMLQVSPNICDNDTELLIEQARAGLTNIDGLIFIRYSDDIDLEDDGSRITNTYYQKMVSKIFDWVIDDIFHFYEGSLLTLDIWNMCKRAKRVDAWVRTL